MTKQLHHCVDCLHCVDCTRCTRCTGRNDVGSRDETVEEFRAKLAAAERRAADLVEGGPVS